MSRIQKIGGPVENRTRSVRCKRTVYPSLPRAHKIFGGPYQTEVCTYPTELGSVGGIQTRVSSLQGKHPWSLDDIATETGYPWSESNRRYCREKAAFYH